jgi:hypothetical protein
LKYFISISILFNDSFSWEIIISLNVTPPFLKFFQLRFMVLKSELYKRGFLLFFVMTKMCTNSTQLKSKAIIIHSLEASLSIGKGVWRKNWIIFSRFRIHFRRLFCYYFYIVDHKTCLWNKISRIKMWNI